MIPQKLFGLSILILVALLAGCQTATREHPVAASGSTHQKLFTEGWLFNLADTTGAENPAFDDASWRKLNLPHDWSIEQPFDQKYASGTGFLPGGIGWYRKHFVFTPEPYQTQLTLRFDGIYRNSTVYLNGHKLGDRPYGYISFEYDLTPHLNPPGQDNVLAVRVERKEFADSRWYPGTGIYRNVYLTATNPTRIDRYGVNVTTSDITKDSATIVIDTTIRNGKAALAPFIVKTAIIDPAGKQVALMSSDSTAPAGNGISHVKQQIIIPKAQLWSSDTPVMYTAVTDLWCPDGCHYDSYNTPFGIRDARFDPNTGFWLNGKNIKLKGVCLHEDAGGLGSAIPQQVWERRLLLLRSAGANAIRCSHNPPAPEFLDLCDRLGFLVMDEAFDEWGTASGGGGKKKWVDSWSGTKAETFGYHSDFDKWSDTDIRDMVLRDRNHPSIIMWSIGNEIDYPNDPFPPNSEELVPIARRLVKDIHELDRSRPVTAACASIGTNKWFQDLDIIGYNYQESRYSADHGAMPTRVIFGSENGMDLKAWKAVADNPFISAQFLWTGIDYLGEAGRPAPNLAWPERSRPDGFLDLAGFKKPMFYFRQSLWSDKPMVKIEENLPVEQPDKTLKVPPGLACYTNCPSVEFFQNKKSLGKFNLPEDTRIIPVPGDPAAGPITAVSFAPVKNPATGETVNAEMTDRFTVSGSPAKISLWKYTSLLGPGDGPNVAQIELSLIDKDGNLSRDAGNEVTVYLVGPGRILAIESGDNNSHENYQAEHHKAYHGRLLIYVETHGEVTVKTSSPGIVPAVITVGK